MKFRATTLPGVWEIEPMTRRDERGSLARLFCDEAFAEIAPGLAFKQVNHTLTQHRGTVRGLHLQREPALEAKLVCCLRGSVFDVAVDLRAGSPTFGHWHAAVLGGDGRRQLLIPAGCAHGFQTLSDEVHMLYQHSAAYSAEHEAGLRYDDPRLGIPWPLPAAHLSARDRSHRGLDDGFEAVRT